MIHLNRLCRMLAFHHNLYFSTTLQELIKKRDNNFLAGIYLLVVVSNEVFFLVN